ncbi:MAG: UvrD-helicase domain-containing protein, partial [Oscillospiraceae bacterium]|nr:UvrD-helicase domain-containing protein [Oscillospiraceae bacterium]
MNQQEFLQVKKMALQKYFSRMNPQQLEAVTTVNGAVLVLAGAGSGKTTVIINRIANMILFGDTSHIETAVPDAEHLQKLQDYIHGKIILNLEELQNIIAVSPVKPWRILAITFTNKAAGELKDRLAKTLGETANHIHASTFHSVCVRILRTCSDKIGYSNQFTIYDMDDSLKVVKSCMKELNISERNFPYKNILMSISQAKYKMISPEKYTEEFEDNYINSVVAKIYQAYQEQLKKSDAMDFEDLIYLTVRIFENYPDILEKYQNKFQYILVDEYQDTNYAQYRLVSLLAKKYGNLCVV